MDVDARGGRLTEFSCSQPGRWMYRYRFIKAATGMPGNLVGPAAVGTDEYWKESRHQTQCEASILEVNAIL